MQLNIPLIIGIALADSANPVALTLLIEHLTDLQKHPNSSPILEGLCYTSGYYVSSFIAGLFILPTFHLLYQLTPPFFTALGAVIVSKGLVELYYHLHSRLQPTLPHQFFNHKLRVDNLLSKFINSPTSSFFYGILVSTHELPVSRFLYLTILAALVITMPAHNTTCMLAIYSAIVITPLVLISLYKQKGLSINNFKLWQTKHHTQIHLGISLLHLILGLWLIIN